MKAMYSSALQFNTLATVKKPKILGFSQQWKKEDSLRCSILVDLNPKGPKKFNFMVVDCFKNARTPSLEAGNFCASLDGNCLLKAKGKEVALCLDERSLFLVGMMGSGKTTVGKILAEALDYTFVDSDKHVEQTMGGTSVAQIFDECGETCFRENESEALRQLSLMPQLVVATGGGAVVRAINWEYMSQGITVFLDVPLDALARRIAAVGTDSRPLLHFDSGDPYTKAFMGLFTLSKKRSWEYANADVTVSLTRLAANLGLEDVSDLTPTAIAIEVLLQIQNYLRGNKNMSNRIFS